MVPLVHREILVNLDHQVRKATREVLVFLAVRGQKANKALRVSEAPRELLGQWELLEIQARKEYVAPRVHRVTLVQLV